MIGSKEIFESIRAIADEALEGNMNALKAYAELQEIEKFTSGCKNEVLPSALDEFDKYDLKTVEEFGYEISKTGSGRYDFKDCPEWVELETKRKEIEEKAKQGFKLGTIIDGIYPANYTPSKSSLSFKPKRK